MTGELDGQVALVTGGGRGVGRAIAQALAAAGASVMVSSRTQEQLDETVALIEGERGRAVSFAADVEQRQAVEAMLAETERALGPVTLLVNNAGATSTVSGPFETLDFDEVRETIDNNLLSAMLCTRLALPGMLERASGRIINVASGSGLVCQPYMNAYSVAKAGLIRFSENLALEVKDRGVMVFAITPGMVHTQATDIIWKIRKMNPLPGWLGSAYGPPHENATDDAAWQPPERAGALCRYLATGAADRLSGRFFSTYDDEAEIVSRSDEVEAGMFTRCGCRRCTGSRGRSRKRTFGARTRDAHVRLARHPLAPRARNMRTASPGERRWMHPPPRIDFKRRGRRDSKSDLQVICKRAVPYQGVTFSTTSCQLVPTSTTTRSCHRTTP